MLLVYILHYNNLLSTARVKNNNYEDAGVYETWVYPYNPTRDMGHTEEKIQIFIIWKIVES